ncbi:MAG: sulfatase [Spirochaetes bacterium]|nr:sulfatase [Spirochaetota bacterium]
MNSPNLLFVFADQHRACDLGCYGNPEVATPHLDALASAGLRFTHCTSNSPLCVPARGSLLTGQFPWNHRALTNDLPVRPDAPSIARVMQASGRRTGYIGKWHLGGIPRDRFIPEGERLGFGAWKAYNCNHHYSKGFYYDEANHRHGMENHAAIAETDLALDFIRQHRGVPWSLHLSWEPPHDPYQDVPAQYRRRYHGADLTLRPNVILPARLSEDRVVDEGTLRENLAGYYSLITLLDDQFGRLLSALEETGQRENTLIVYTSDHGDLHASHGYLNKQMPHAESVGVPLLIAGPGVRRGVCEETIGLVDLPVTLAAGLGARWEDPSDGQDLSSLLTDPKAAGPEGVLIFDLVPVHQSAARGAPEWLGVKTKEATWAMGPDGKDWIHYDDAKDPFQRLNLAGASQGAPDRAALRSLTERLLARHRYRFRPWAQMLKEDKFLGEWNRSQAHFHLPLLD